MRFTPFLILCAVAACVAPAFAHVGAHPSIHDTLAGIVERLRSEHTAEELVQLTRDQVEASLTQDERHVLATEYLTFEISTSAVVSVFCQAPPAEQPFWLSELGFKKTPLQAVADGDAFDMWERTFPAGRLGLGVCSFTGEPAHYFVALKPVSKDMDLEVTNIYPGYHTLGVLEVGQLVYSDDDNQIEELPEALAGRILLRGADDRQEAAKLVNFFRATPYASSADPDHVVLTWSEDPKTSQTIQWRTSPEVQTGVVAYQKKSAYNAFNRQLPTVVRAQTKRLETPDVVNDPVVHRHTALLRDLEPGTTYVYAVGTGEADAWSELAEFTTAPSGVEPFSFIYMGDAQNGLERWGSLVQGAFRRRPDAAFYIMAGDLVNRGAERDDWDVFFENAEGVYNQRQLVPAIGNHENHGGEPELYLEHFALPTNGPQALRPERAYAFTYSNALFVVLDSNEPVEDQAEWLEKTLSETDATWKFVIYNHPAYSSSPTRNNPDVREVWGGIFDKYHVDLALQGHDHAYLRTYPMRGGERVGKPSEGTIYIVSVSGTKFYEQGDFDYTEVGFTNLPTYQVLDIQISGDRLLYRAHDIDGNVRDEFVIEK